MDTISRYLSKDYLITFLMTLAVFTFVMSIGAVVRAIDLMARGISGQVILRVFASNMPYLLSFSIPMSVLTTVLLVFTRLSLNGEITAMKACGLSIWQIVAAPVMISIVLSVICVYINSELAPRSHYSKRRLLRGVGVDEPVDLLEEGRFVRDFPGIMIYVGNKDGNRVKDIVVYELGRRGVKRSVRARWGEIKPDDRRKILRVVLHDVRIDQRDMEHPMDISRTRYITAREYPVTLDFSKIWKEGGMQKKIADMTLQELIHAIRHVRETYPDLKYEDLIRQRMALVVGANKRLSLSLSCFAFTLLGIPLGLRSRRRESSVGVGISLLVVLVYYLFIIVADSLTGHPEWHPELIVWIPIVAAEVAGFLLLCRAN